MGNPEVAEGRAAEGGGPYRKIRRSGEDGRLIAAPTPHPLSLMPPPWLPPLGGAGWPQAGLRGLPLPKPPALRENGRGQSPAPTAYSGHKMRIRPLPKPIAAL